MDNERRDLERVAEAKQQIEAGVAALNEIAQRHEGGTVAHEIKTTVDEISANLDRVTPVREGRVPPVRE